MLRIADMFLHESFINDALEMWYANVILRLSSATLWIWNELDKYFLFQLNLLAMASIYVYIDIG